MNKKIGVAGALFALWFIAMAGAFVWSGAAGVVWPERIARCVALIAVALLPHAIYRVRRPVPCPAK